MLLGQNWTNNNAIVLLCRQDTLVILYCTCAADMFMIIHIFNSVVEDFFLTQQMCLSIKVQLYGRDQTVPHPIIIKCLTYILPIHKSISPHKQWNMIHTLLHPHTLYMHIRTLIYPPVSTHRHAYTLICATVVNSCMGRSGTRPATSWPQRASCAPGSLGT